MASPSFPHPLTLSLSPLGERGLASVGPGRLLKKMAQPTSFSCLLPPGAVDRARASAGASEARRRNGAHVRAREGAERGLGAPASD